ncbi:MAG: ATP-binding protein, partial [Candidatus Aminicenantes bacterium]|nr:ATP-binding protein [Candidatus Aminicenantes bacterium]
RIKIHTEKIRAFKTPSKSELKNVLITENKSLSKDLRLNLLPVIVDALANVEFDALLQNFPRQIREALNAFPERNEIFQERDLKSLVPASKINDVPVRALVLNEIFPGLIKDSDTLLAEVKRISDELFRDVSQIDQIVDYNSESALALLEEKKGAGTIEEAHRMAGEGLDRAGNQAAGLIAKTRSVASLVSENLAESSERFINSLQGLENSEKIIQMKLRYARAQAKKKIQGYGVRAWGKIKASFAVALGFLGKVFRRARATYYRFRKLSGLTPQEIGLEDKLALFLHRTEGRIASLPYVYQRLFRIEPLTDERFHIGRDEDKAELKECLKSWQAGQYAATALVGEKGSGKTTLLNFAMAEYFKGLPLRKTDLVDTTIQTTKELFELLKKLFDRPEADTLDALERELAASEEKSICILENSQNMFLRTVGGFEAIER